MIVNLYRQLRDDPRLQKNWEQNQPRTDRALESVLIARTPREVATTVLLFVKRRYEPAATRISSDPCHSELLAFARSQGMGGRQLANLIERSDADPDVVMAAIESLRFYHNRSEANELVRLAWTPDGLQNLSRAPVSDIFSTQLRPTWADRKSAGLRDLAKLLLDAPSYGDDYFRTLLREIPGLGPERADAVGVFGFGRGWPIVDEYLWRLLRRHGVLKAEH